MIGLRPYDRDPSLPATLGDEGLGPVSPAEVCAIARGLVRPATDAPEPVEAVLEYARWKPGVSATWSYALALSSGERVPVTLKIYRAHDKVAALRDRPLAHAHYDAEPRPLEPFLADPERRLTVWTFPADRALRGLARALNVQRASRLVERALPEEELGLRKRGATVEVLRYKPERRAVILLKVPRHGGRETRSLRTVLRIHPVDKARRVAAVRAACPAADAVGPRLLTHEASTGTVVESWLRGTACPPDDFARAAESAALLAALHGASCAERPLEPITIDPSLPWLERIQSPEELREGLPPLDPNGPATWIHGDVQPDQFFSTRAGLRLLDLDEVTVGFPELDLADWIAEHLAERPGTSLEAAAAPLLEGYGPARDRLRQGVLRLASAHALARKAAGCLRRMELDGIVRARALLERARAIAGGEVS